ncbi:MAG TPA: zinc-dependent alcohol dehydrogenase [Phycisphaerales bacterium]|nr:zinc-dependent alcohol dehydrogenase [Phycisphaerales bacterium]
MKALCWYGTKDVRVEEVPDPRILNPRDAIIRVTSTAICGSDLHLYNGVFKGMKKGDILGHEFMGEVIAVGPGVKNLREGDRVVVPFHISCGSCFFCRMGEWSACDNSNPNMVEAETLLGQPVPGMFGYTHLTGGYAGGQAEMVRVPFADVGPLKVPAGLPDEKVLFLSDILPTGWFGAENCSVRPGDTVAVWGCGPVGLLAMQSLRVMGAERIIAIDTVPERLELARRTAGAEPLDYEKQDVYETLMDITGGRGPDSCLDAVGMEAHGTGFLDKVDAVKQRLMIENDRPAVLRQMIRCCRKAGTISLLGVYSGFVDTFPMGIAFNKGLRFRMGQTPVHRYREPLLQMVADGKLQPDAVISHRVALDDAADAYAIFEKKEASCTKVVLKPGPRPTVNVRSTSRSVSTV